MRIKVYLRSPCDVLAPNMSPGIKNSLPDVELEADATVGNLLKVLGIGRTRPIVLINKKQQGNEEPLQEGDRVDLVLPIAGG